MDEFENNGGASKFIENISKSLWLNESQVKVTDIRSGSVIIDYQIREDENNMMSLKQI